MLPFDSWLEVSPTDPTRAVRVSGRADRDRGSWCAHVGAFVVWAARLGREVVDVDLVDFADPYPTPEELVIAVDEVRALNREAEAAWHRAQRARLGVPRRRFATPEQIDAAIKRARGAQEARSE